MWIIVVKRKVLMKIHRMSIEEKLAHLSETDKAYVQCYIEKAVLELKKQAIEQRSFKQGLNSETLPKTSEKDKS
jgi:hypothetical protein